MQNKTHPALLAFTVSLLSACGGGGNNPTVDPQPQRPKELYPAPAQATDPAYSKFLTAEKVRNWTTSRNTSDDKIVINGHTLLEIKNQQAKLDISGLPNGWFAAEGKETVAGHGTFPVYIRSYTGFYGGAHSLFNAQSGSTRNYGVVPMSKDAPERGKATYNGVAFDNTDKGTFTYDVDFGQKKGHGRIEGLTSYGNIILQEADIKSETKNEATNFYVAHDNKSGIAETEKKGKMYYHLDMYGPQAAEMGGGVYTERGSAALFYGTRGAITE